jgi:AraC-like DNA-binding protein
MKEYVYETISHPVDLYQEMQKLNQSVSNIESESKNENLGIRELFDLGSDNWAIYSSVRYCESIKQTMQTNYSKNWMRMTYVRNDEDDMVLDVEVSMANHEKLINGNRSGFETYKSETWVQRNGDVRMLFVFLNEDFLKRELWHMDLNKITNARLRPRINEIQSKIVEMGKKLGVDKFNGTENRFADLEKNEKTEIILKLIINSLWVIFPNEQETISDKARLEIMGIRQAEQKLMADFSNDAITLDELAKIAGVNRVKFQELFKKMYGYSFYAYYQKGRFDYAKKLIQEENYNLTDAAYAVGFKNLTHFSRQFERLMGVKPMQLKYKTFSIY